MPSSPLRLRLFLLQYEYRARFSPAVRFSAGHVGGGLSEALQLKIRHLCQPGAELVEVKVAVGIEHAQALTANLTAEGIPVFSAGAHVGQQAGQ